LNQLVLIRIKNIHIKLLSTIVDTLKHDYSFFKSGDGTFNMIKD